MKRAYVDIPEGQIHYRTDGSGEPLLLLHRTPSSSDEYSLMILALAKSYRVIAMDTIGYGISDSPHSGVTIEDYAQSVKNFLLALGIKKANINGYHNGATIAVEVAAAYPELVDKLILSGCPYYAPEVRHTLLNDPRFRPMEITEDGSHIMRIWDVLKKDMPHAGPENWQKLLTHMLITGSRSLDAHLAVFAYGIEPRLSLIKSPTLLISATGDTFYKRLEAIHKLIPQSTTRIIEGDSLITLTKPDKFAQAILEFLKNPGA